MFQRILLALFLVGSVSTGTVPNSKPCVEFQEAHPMQGLTINGSTLYAIVNFHVYSLPLSSENVLSGGRFALFNITHEGLWTLWRLESLLQLNLIPAAKYGSFVKLIHAIYKKAPEEQGSFSFELLSGNVTEALKEVGDKTLTKRYAFFSDGAGHGYVVWNDSGRQVPVFRPGPFANADFSATYDVLSALDYPSYFATISKPGHLTLSSTSDSSSFSKLNHLVDELNQIRKFINLAIAVLSVLAKEDNCKCGVYGVPNNGMVTKGPSGDCSVAYICKTGTVLIGDSQRKCVEEKFTGSTPICLTVVAKEDKKGNEDLHFNGTGLEALNSESLNCSKEAFAITFQTLMIKSLGAPLQSSDVSVAYAFNVSQSVTAVNISQSGCCLQRVVIADPGVSLSCGTPDIPPGVECGYKLTGPTSIVCTGLEKWSHPNEAVQCVADHSSLWLVIGGVVLIILVLVAAFFFAICIRLKTLTRQLMDRYHGTKIEYKEVTLVKPRNKEGFCQNYVAQYNKKEVLAHVCDLSKADKKAIPPVEQMRCLYSVVHFDFKHQNIVAVLALSLDPKKNPILVFESSSNGTLNDYVKANKELTQKDFLALCLSVCNARHSSPKLRAKSCTVDDSKIVKIGNFKMSQELGNYDQFLCKVSVSREQCPGLRRRRLPEM
ncbi:Inactive tyrosine-protein kinase transmembrane receptor ror1 [Tyrophagus putrescentiae]|nr:Inactive tyrosine-protein kinase transmembrane receptor ror1 [Tyrophagus putrescentiae]